MHGTAFTTYTHPNSEPPTSPPMASAGLRRSCAEQGTPVGQARKRKGPGKVREVLRVEVPGR
eukprot:12340431-Alexandrium_andersonii.AAC.1